MRQRHLLPLSALVAIMLVMAAAPARSAPLQAPLSNVFGLNSNIASRHPTYETLETPANVVANLGAGWVREDFQMNRLMPEPGTFNWNWHDRMVELFTARGIQVIGLLNGPTPGWMNGQGGPRFIPPDPQVFAQFAYAVAAHYKGRVNYWEIWNEPDNANYWQPQRDAAAYATLLKAAYAAIKAADPNAQVLSGSLVSPQPAADFLKQLYDNGAWNAFDIISLHPYTDPRGPEDGQIGVAGIGTVRGLVQTLGPKPIWATEFGWSTGPADRTAGQGVPVDSTTQANFLIRGSVLLRAAGAERVLWYNLKDTETRDGHPHNFYGLVNFDPSLENFDAGLNKPAFLAYQVMTQQLATTGAATTLDLGASINSFDFEQFGTWPNGDEANGTLTQSSEQVHSGQASAKLSYNFRTAGNDYVVFIPPAPVAIPDNTSKLGIWIYGDGSAHAVNVWLRDSQGEVLQFRLGPAGGPGWHFSAASLSGPVAPGNVITNEQNRQLDFPVSLTALVLDDDPNTATGEGTIYLDDLTASLGAESYAVRFSQGAEVVDVIWAPNVTQVVVPTQSGQVTRVRAWGETTVEPTNGGRYTFSVGPDPVFIRHTPGSGGSPPVNPPSDGNDSRCFPETGQCIAGRIREYWEQNGGLAVFGYPTTPLRVETIEGRQLQVQWFERNRLELHPENGRPYDVLLGRLGADRLAQQGRDWQSFPKTAPQADCRFFPETGHNVCGRILEAWHASGMELDGQDGKSEGENLALFGLPLSELQPETIEGRQLMVQWFERGRFELHPENSSPFDVLLGLLGNEVLAGK